MEILHLDTFISTYIASTFQIVSLIALSPSGVRILLKWFITSFTTQWGGGGGGGLSHPINFAGDTWISNIGFCAPRNQQINANMVNEVWK